MSTKMYNIRLNTILRSGSINGFSQQQWFIFDQIGLQFRHAAIPQIDCPTDDCLILPHLADSRVRLSNEWTPTLCDVMMAWPWLQCQRKFVSADVSCNTFSFDWRNQYDKRLN